MARKRSTRPAARPVGDRIDVEARWKRQTAAGGGGGHGLAWKRRGSSGRQQTAAARRARLTRSASTSADHDRPQQTAAPRAHLIRKRSQVRVLDRPLGRPSACRLHRGPALVRSTAPSGGGTARHGGLRPVTPIGKRHPEIAVPANVQFACDVIPLSNSTEPESAANVPLTT